MYLLGSIQQAIIDIWNTYSNDVIPVLITIALALLTWIAIKIKSNAQLTQAKTELQIKALQEVANREDNKPQLEEQSQQINSLTGAVMYLGEMMNEAFQNSSISPEVKENIKICLDKIKYGSQEDLVKSLQEQNAKLLEQVSALTEQVTTKAAETVTEEVKTRVRR